MTTISDPRDLALGAAVSAFRAGVLATRIGMVPVRIAARAPVVGGALAGIEAQGRRARDQAVPELVGVLDRLLAGPLTEAIAHSLIEQRVLERVAKEVVATADVVSAVADALDSPLLLEITDRLLSSEEMQSAIAHIAATPELRQALAEQSSGLAEEMVSGVRRRSESIDERAERAVRGWRRRPRPKPQTT